MGSEPEKDAKISILALASINESALAARAFRSRILRTTSTYGNKYRHHFDVPVAVYSDEEYRMKIDARARPRQKIKVIQKECLDDQLFPFAGLTSMP